MRPPRWPAGSRSDGHGSGGAAEVFEASDDRLGGRRVAVKLLELAGGEAARRLATRRARRRVGTRARRVLDAATTVPALVASELLPGHAARGARARGRLDAAEALARVAAPLGALTPSPGGRVHRDVKPENLVAGADSVFRLSTWPGRLRGATPAPPRASWSALRYLARSAGCCPTSRADRRPTRGRGLLLVEALAAPPWSSVGRWRSRALVAGPDVTDSRAGSAAAWRGP